MVIPLQEACDPIPKKFVQLTALVYTIDDELPLSSVKLQDILEQSPQLRESNGTCAYVNMHHVPTDLFIYNGENSPNQGTNQVVSAPSAVIGI